MEGNINNMSYQQYIDLLHSHKNRKIISGDILSYDVWKSLRERSSSLVEKKFDLITIRPLGGWENLLLSEYYNNITIDSSPKSAREYFEDDFEEYGKLFFLYFNRITEVLSDNGEIYMELPHLETFSAEAIDKLVVEISHKYKDLDLIRKGGVVLLKKKSTLKS